MENLRAKEEAMAERAATTYISTPPATINRMKPNNPKKKKEESSRAWVRVKSSKTKNLRKKRSTWPRTRLKINLGLILEQVNLECVSPSLRRGMIRCLASSIKDIPEMACWARINSSNKSFNTKIPIWAPIGWRMLQEVELLAMTSPRKSQRKRTRILSKLYLMLLWAHNL